ncbi:MAG TPA: lipopolysaccharide biosynthesis protein [Actinomycetes bacterium]|nr:lipopolysaccharide biosynthesis protein [Actinomycetes bacterium]
MTDVVGGAPATSMPRRFAAEGAWALGGRVVTMLGGLASGALLSRLLSPDDLGGYLLVASFVTAGALAGSLGLPQVVVRLVAGALGSGRPARARSALETAFALGALGAAGTAALYAGFVDHVGTGLLGRHGLLSVTGLAAVWVAVLVVQALVTEAFRGLGDARRAAALGGPLPAGLLVAALLVTGWHAGRAALSDVVLLAVVAALLTLLAGCWMLWRKVGQLPRPLGAEERAGAGMVLRIAWPLLLTSLTLFASAQADLWIVGAFRPHPEVAVYGVAARAASVVAVPLLVVNAVLAPAVARLHAQGGTKDLERVLRGTATLASLPALAVLTVFAVAGAPLLGLAYGAYYRAGGSVLTLLALGQAAGACAGSCGLTLAMTGRQALLAAITLGCGALTVAAAVLAAGPFGMTGVAGATAAGMALQNLAMLLGVRLTVGVWTHLSPVLLARARTLRLRPAWQAPTIDRKANTHEP